MEGLARTEVVKYSTLNLLRQVINKGMVSFRDPELPTRAGKTLQIHKDTDLSKVIFDRFYFLTQFKNVNFFRFLCGHYANSRTKMDQPYQELKTTLEILLWFKYVFVQDF